MRDSAGELASAALFDLGTTGIETFEASADSTGLRAYFDGPVPGAAVETVVAECGAGEVLSSFVGERADEAWSENWKLHFRAQPIGKRLFVCPPWEPAPCDGRIAIVIEPGMAFGTGQHATTRGCLVLLEELLTQRTPAPALALDLGTGSGILAIALAKLGVERIHAVDNDPDALRVAAQNAIANSVDDRLRFGTNLASVPEGCAIIVANLFANLLVEMAPEIDQHVRRDGVIVLSGILDPDVPTVLAAFAVLGWTPERSFDEAPWKALVLARTTT